MGQGQDGQSELSFREDDDLRIIRPQPTICKIPRSTFFVCGFGILLAFAVIGISMAMMHSALPAFHETIAVEDILEHLQAFQDIANNNNGSRTIFTGYNESVQYVRTILEETRFNVTIHEFDIPVFREVKPPTLAVEGENGTFVEEEDLTQFKTLTYSGVGEAVAPLSLIPDFGCNKIDYAQAKRGNIFLIQRGGEAICTFALKTELAQEAGASGVIIVFNDTVSAGILNATESVKIPVIGVSKVLGKELETLGAKSVKMSVSATLTNHTTMNIFAETNHGSKEDIVILGSHLDSVEAGAGINDNGSGSAATLAIALAFHRNSLRPKNRVIFAWFGAEENGLLGSKNFVETLKKDGTLNNIAAYLNMDMIGSPNYFRGVYNGSAADESIRIGSENIQKMFEAHFEEHSLECEGTDFDGRSDYGPFIANGIPSGGVFSGAEKLKTLEQREKYGGLALVPFDPCYHLECDSIENISEKALYEFTRAVANVLYDLSHDPHLRVTLNTNPTP